MDLVHLFVSFTNAVGFGPFMFLVIAYFLFTGLPSIRKPINLAFIILLVAFTAFHKSMLFLFWSWCFVFMVLFIALQLCLKSPEDATGWYWLILMLTALTWVGAV